MKLFIRIGIGVSIALNVFVFVVAAYGSYDGGTKQKNFEELREIRRSFGTLDAG